jgi:hypothetical protein
MPSNVQAAVSQGFPRVIGAGLPHTGTSTLHEMLRRLGCCYNAHNLHCTSKEAAPVLQGLWSSKRTTNTTKLGTKLDRHYKEGDRVLLLEEFSHFQCVSDSPWMDSWRELADYDPRSRVVLTISRTALDYAVTKFLFMHYVLIPRVKTPKSRSKVEAELREDVVAYVKHRRAVRVKYGNSGRLLEFCLQCGDGYGQLAAGLGLDTSRADQLLSSTGLNRSSPAPRVNAAKSERLRNLKKWLLGNYSHLHKTEAELWTTTTHSAEGEGAHRTP